MIDRVLRSMMPHAEFETICRCLSSIQTIHGSALFVAQMLNQGMYTPLAAAEHKVGGMGVCYSTAEVDGGVVPSHGREIS